LIATAAEDFVVRATQFCDVLTQGRAFGSGQWSETTFANQREECQGRMGRPRHEKIGGLVHLKRLRGPIHSVQGHVEKVVENDRAFLAHLGKVGFCRRVVSIYECVVEALDGRAIFP
jgi:hypothetical protein